MSNVSPPSFPDGLDVEAFHFPALQRAWTEASLRSEREHVTPYIRNHPELFSQENVLNGEDMSELRWTLDEPADYEMLGKIFAELAGISGLASWQQVLSLLANHPEWTALNQRFHRNEGYSKSLTADKHEH